MRERVTMPVLEFLELRGEKDFEGFAGNVFDIEYFAEHIEHMRNNGLDVDNTFVRLITPYNDEQRLYSDVLLIPLTDQYSFGLMAAIIDMHPDEFDIDREMENHIRLWWD